MRYLIQNCFSEEIEARKKYIFGSLKLWCSQCKHPEGFIQLTSIPSTELDILFIVGHNRAVLDFLQSEIVPEKTIVAITCDGSIGFSKLNLPKKVLYLPYQDKLGLAELLKGSSFGFDFDLTESEIKFYNAKKENDIRKRLDLSFKKYKG